MSAHFKNVEYIYRKTIPVPEDTPKVRGYDFNSGVDYQALMKSFYTTGLQATNMSLAIEQINQMIEKRSQSLEDHKNELKDCPPSCCCHANCTIFLSYTSNLVSSGVRESIRYLAQHKMVDVLVTTAGGIEEDLIKCLGPLYLGDFTLPGGDLFRKGLDRIGNLLMPDENYCAFDKWITPILKKMLEEQDEGTHWTPSTMIHRLGKEINNPDSICYWAYKNNIPIFSPALTDGAIGDMLFLFAMSNSGLIIDIAQDIWKLNIMAVAATNTGLIVLGGGLAKHHICNANAWRNGADYAVFINTAQEFDGCDSGAKPDEAVSWGKITAAAKPVKLYAEVSLVFPLIVAETFARHVNKKTPPKDTE